MNKKILSITILLFVLFSISCVSANDLNDTQGIESESVIAISNDNIENLSLGASSFTQLQNEIDKVPNGGVLKLNSDYNSAPKSWVNIDKDITIDGQGHTIDCLGQDDSFAFKSTKGTIVLENLIIKNSKASNVYSYGGAIYIEGSAQYKIINCTFINNYASMSGGAIFNGVREKTLIIKNSKFINCTTRGSGAAIYSRGDAIVEDCYFENNQGHMDGGAIYARSLNIINSKFISNKALQSYQDAYSLGGAVCVKEDVIVENCKFSNNYAYNSGGAIFAHNNIIVKNSSFTKNSAHEGGAIYGLGTNTIIGSSIFTQNQADSRSGGAIYSDKYVHIDNSTFVGNMAKGKGGAIFTYYLVFLNPISFINNSANDHGGAIYTDYISNDVCNIIFDGNHVDSDFGGAIYINKNSGNVKFINTTFINNHANAGDGGAIYSDSGSTNIALINSVFKNNYANGGKEKRYGGAIRCCNKLSIDNCTFMDNWAENLGGAVYTNLLESVKNSVFISNRAKEGGAIYVNNKCAMSISNSFFKNNRATDGRGGAIYTDSKSSSMSISNNVFIGNDASGQGKDVFNSGSYTFIDQNWWGTNSPSFDNERLMEYHTIGSNERRYDANPNKVSISGDKTGYVGVDTSLKVIFTSSISYYEFNSMKFSSDKNGTFTLKNINGNTFEVSYVPNAEGNNKITVVVDSQTLTYDLNVLKTTVYGKNITKVQGDAVNYTAVFKDSNGAFLKEGSEVVFEINNVKYTSKVLKDGIATLTTLNTLQPGIYTVKAINGVTGESFTNQIKILSRNATYNISDIFAIKFASNTSNNDKVIFKLGNYSFASNITDGVAFFKLNVTAGNYVVNVLYNDKVVYTVNIKVLKQYSKTSANLTKTSYGSLIPIYENETFSQVNNVIYSVLGDNFYRYIFPNGESSIIYNVTVSNNNEFEKVLKKIAGNDFKADIIIINLKKGTYKLSNGLYSDQEWKYYIHLTHGSLYINGNGATFDDEYKNGFITLEKDTKISVNNLTFTRFKRVFVNNGDIYCNGCSFVKNDASFWATVTKGSVIYNKNTATFVNCTFDNNNNKHGVTVNLYDADLAAGLLYAEKGSLTNFVLCKILSDHDTIHAVDGSMVVLYDEGAENYNLLTNDVNNNFETGSCLDFRKYSSFNSNKTGTFNYDDALSLVNDYVTAIYKNDSSSFVFNLKKGTYEIPLDKYLSIAGKFDFRTFNSKGTFFSKGGKKDSSYIHHYFLFDIASRPVVINGNGAEIKLTGSSDSKDNHFAFVPKHGSLTLINLTISGFNDAILNYGNLILINCTFKDNRIHYFYQNKESEYGGAIRNYGSVYAYNTTFTNNRASYGGAYFGNGPSSFAQFYNCTFNGNTRLSNLAWYNGDDNPIYLDNQAMIKIINCSGLSESNIIAKNDALFYYRSQFSESILSFYVDDMPSLYKLAKLVTNNIEYDIINATFKKGVYNVLPNSKVLFDFNYGTLILNGNDASIYVQNSKDNDDTQFLVTKSRSSVYINNLTIQGFNIAIENLGAVNIFNCHFNYNCVDYMKKEDYGGAIVNKGGSITIFNSSFTGNYAKYAGAIYNKATLSVVMSNFANNHAYSSKNNVDIYNHETSATIMSLNSYPSVVDHYPMAAWKKDLLETGITLSITIITMGISCGITHAAIESAHMINMLVGTIVGTAGGLANAITYSVDNQDYSQFASRLFNGINDGLAAVTYGEKFNILITNIHPTYSPADVGKMATNVIFDKTVKAALSLIKDIVCN